MKLYMKQKVFSLKDDFDIYDEHQVPYFKVEGKLISIGRQVSIKDAQTREELANIKEKLLTFMPKMVLYRQGKAVATIKKKLTFLKNNYEIEELGWQIKGNFMGHNYQIVNRHGHLIATISKKYFSWSDTFEFDIKDDQADLITVIGVIIAIDEAMGTQDSD